MSMRILSWNVNGIRAVERKGFLDWMMEVDADIMCLQETKAHPDQLSKGLIDPKGYQSYWSSAEKKGYSGCVIYSKAKPKKVLLLLYVVCEAFLMRLFNLGIYLQFPALDKIV